MTHDPQPDEPDEFTARLRAQPPAALPAHWRAEILAAASSQSRSPDRPSRWRRAADALGTWLWPHPLAYAGLAAAWVCIGVLRLLTAPALPISSPSTWGMVASNLKMDLEDSRPILESIQLASRVSSRDPAIANRP